MTSWAAKYSTCGTLATTLTVTAPASIAYGAKAVVTATLKVTDLTAYERLGGNPVSGRVVTLQTRAPGSADLAVGRDAGDRVDIGHLHEDPDVDRRPPGAGRVQDADRRRTHGRYLVGPDDRRRGVPHALPVVDRGFAVIGRRIDVLAVVAGLVVTALACLACGSSAPAAPSGSAPASPTASAASSSAVGARARRGVGDPPIASLRVEGGDPVVGQLGTYSWAGGGSSSPWLPGAPIAVGAEEPLIVTMDQPFIVTAWTARLAPAADQDGAQAVVVAEGDGQPILSVPKRGSWTLAVTVTFGTRGSATYAWRLDVS